MFFQKGKSCQSFITVNAKSYHMSVSTTIYFSCLTTHSWKRYQLYFQYKVSQWVFSLYTDMTQQVTFNSFPFCCSLGWLLNSDLKSCLQTFFCAAYFYLMLVCVLFFVKLTTFSFSHILWKEANSSINALATI